MTKHTPGPWEACNSGRCQCVIVWSKPADSPVATAKLGVACVHGEWGDPGMAYGEVPAIEQQANARLIGAAPDLLAVCRAVLAFKGLAMSSGGMEIWDAAKAAIFKAEGR